MTVLDLFVPLKPPSINSLYNIVYNTRHVYMKKEVRNFKSLFKNYIRPISRPINNSKLKLCLLFHDEWYFKNGKFRRVDLQNLEKCVIDSLCEKIGVDDSSIWEKETRKVQDEKRQGIGILLKVIDE